MNLRTFLLDLLERSATTYLEALLGFLLVANVLDVDALTVAAIAALPALFSALKAGALAYLKIRPARSFAVDLLERTVATYVVSFLGLASTNPGDVATYRLAFAAAAPAALAVLKAGLASRVGNPDSASLAPITA